MRTTDTTTGNAVLAAVLATILAGCGGGGGGGGGTTPPAKKAPTASAGADVAQRELTAVTLSGSASDPDGDNLTYEWTQVDGPAIDLGSRDALALQFTLPDIEENTSYTFKLTVSDGTATASDTVNVTSTINGVPVVTVSDDVTEREGATVTLTGSALDPDGQSIVSYEWSQTAGPDLGLGTVSGESIDLELPDVAEDTTYTFQLAASDGDDTGTATVNVISKDNRAPEFTVTAPATVNELANVEMSLDASDADGDHKTVQWELLTEGLDIDLTGATTATVQFSAPIIDVPAVAAEFRVRVTDNATFPKTTEEIFTVAIAQEALIVFTQSTATGYNLYRTDIDGNRELLFASDADWQLAKYAVSPNRRYVAISLQNSAADDIRIIDVENPSSVVSARPASAPGGFDIFNAEMAWSPNSSMLAYRGDVTLDNVYELITVNADGTNARIVGTPYVDKRSVITGYQLATDHCFDSDPDCSDGFEIPNADVLDFAWSPDSKWIAFRMQATPQPKAATELLTVRLSDAAIFTVSDMFVQRITDGDPATGPDCTGGAVWCWEADTNSPLDYIPDANVANYQWKQRDDGVWLAYKSFERRNSNDLLNQRLWVVDATGAERTQVAHFAVFNIDKVNVEHWAWSPDGAYLAWTERLVDNHATYSYWLMTAPFEPGVTPNGNRIDAAAMVNHTLPDGSSSKAGLEAHVESFEWSPDNRNIAFKAKLRHPDVYELYVVDRDWSATDGTMPNVVGDLFRDDYSAFTWDGAFYSRAADDIWDTDGLFNKNGNSVDLTDNVYDGTPDGRIDRYEWDDAGSSLYMRAALRMKGVYEAYRWDAGTSGFEVLSHLTRDERNNTTAAALPDSIADSAIADSTNARYGVPRGDVSLRLSPLPGSGTPPLIGYMAHERYSGIQELWMTQPDGTPLLLSDLFRDADDNGIPDSDSDLDGLPDGDLNSVIPLGGTRLLYLASERNIHEHGDLVFVDAANPSASRQYLSEISDGTTIRSVDRVTVAFPGGKQTHTIFEN